MDTVKDHLKSKKHLSSKEQKTKEGDKSRQVLLTCKSVAKSNNLREEFILDYIMMCSMSDIPLQRTEKMKPFLLKYCKQAGALPQDKFLRSECVPRLYDQHFEALKTLLADAPVSIADIQDHSILNVIALVRGKSYLIGVARMEGCNNAILSQAIIKTVRPEGEGNIHSLY